MAIPAVGEGRGTWWGCPFTRRHLHVELPRAPPLVAHTGYSTTETSDGDYTPPQPLRHRRTSPRPAVDANPPASSGLQVECAARTAHLTTIDPFNNHRSSGVLPSRRMATLEEADPARHPGRTPARRRRLILTARVGGDLAYHRRQLRLRFLVAARLRAPGRAAPPLDATNATTGDQFFRPTGVTGAENTVSSSTRCASDGDVRHLPSRGERRVVPLHRRRQAHLRPRIDSGGAIDSPIRQRLRPASYHDGALVVISQRPPPTEPAPGSSSSSST